MDLQCSLATRLMLFHRRPILSDEVVTGLFVREPYGCVGAERLVGRLLQCLVEQVKSKNSDHDRGDTSKYENCRPLLRSEGHVALVYKADRASGIERG
jgi:hypothetical protein